MAILKISQNFSRNISTKVKQNVNLAEDSLFQMIINNINILLEKDLFVIVKNIGFNNNKQIFETFVKSFGKYYGAVENTDIKVDCKYTGCSYKPIELHNDDAVDLENQPIYGFIQVVKEDPLLKVLNGIIKIDDIVEYLKIYDKEFLDSLYTVEVPMLSYGVNYDGENKEKIEIHKPIFYVESEQNNVRFDLTRINYYYWKTNKKQSIEEKALIYKFLNLSKQLKKDYILECGDILIHNNKRCLHDRSECSLEINLDGTFNTREIFVSFVRE